MTLSPEGPSMKLANFKFAFLFLGLLSFQSFAMSKALNTAAAGMAAQEANVNTISNNIANVNTTGFKRDRAEFEDLLYQTYRDPGARSSASTQYGVGLQVGSGSRVSAVRKEFTQGSPQMTGNPFDLMINGEGFFGVVLPNNELLYTRDGSFNVSAQGQIVNRQGYTLYPGFTIPANTNSVHISETGTVDAFVSGQVEPVNLGSIPVFNFTNVVGLKSAGGNLYRVTESSGAPIQQVASEGNAGQITQGALEASNVNVMVEMTNLIKGQRGFEMNSKVMGVADQMLQTVNNIK